MYILNDYILNNAKFGDYPYKIDQMSFGTRLQKARKDKGLSQSELAKIMGTKGPAIGRYERDEMKPSIDAAAKMAKTLEVSLDYLVGHTDLELDRKMIQRIVEVSKMEAKKKEMVFMFLDAFIKQSRLDQVLG